MPHAQKYPSFMKAVTAGKDCCNLTVKEIKVPEAGPGEVLVKISYAPVNPSDIARIRKFYREGNGQFIPGLEGSGIVVASGKGLLPRLWFGRRVACSSADKGGTWAEYMVTRAGLCFPLGRKISDDQGSMTLVNPMTALAFLDIAKKGRHKAIINNAAASSLGRMLEILSKKEGIRIINIVRKKEQTARLKASGSDYVLNISDDTFLSELENISRKLNATLFLDTVCNDRLQEIIGILPPDSSVIIYGNRSEAGNIRVNPRDLMDRNIDIRGFFLGSYAARNGLFRNMLNLRKVRKLMENDLKISIRHKYPLEKAQEAVDEYSSGMSGGKILLSPLL
jgi:NADPH:quinone reductase-like Zn-dependent oxidoreductase